MKLQIFVHDDQYNAAVEDELPDKIMKLFRKTDAINNSIVLKCGSHTFSLSLEGPFKETSHNHWKSKHAKLYVEGKKGKMVRWIHEPLQNGRGQWASQTQFMLSEDESLALSYALL